MLSSLYESEAPSSGLGGHWCVVARPVRGRPAADVPVRVSSRPVLCHGDRRQQPSRHRSDARRLRDSRQRPPAGAHDLRQRGAAVHGRRDARHQHQHDRTGSKDLYAGAEQFLLRLLPHDKAIVGAFNDKIEFATGFTSDRNSLVSALKDLDFGNETRLYDALYASLDQLEKVEGRKVILLFTDGADFGSRLSSGTRAGAGPRRRGDDLRHRPRDRVLQRPERASGASPIRSSIASRTRPAAAFSI